MAGAGNDRLSSLPDELLHHILSFILSTKLVARTSLLSRRWRYLWAHHPNLHFEIRYSKSGESRNEVDSMANSYVLAVDRCLSSFLSPSLDSFSITLWLPTDHTKAQSQTADRWLRFAGLRSARKLSVAVWTQPKGGYGRIPSSIFSCRSLTTLIVRCCVFPSVPPNFLGFKNLTHLLMGCGSISNQAVEDLLEGCPLLEDLRLIGLSGLTFVDISLPRLKHLVLLSLHHAMPDEKYTRLGWIGGIIEAPDLRSIDFGGSITHLDLGSFPVLNEADLSSHSDEAFKGFDDWMKVVNAVSNASLLKVDSWFYQFVIPVNYACEPVFKNLKELRCDIKWITGSVLRALCYGLGQCPLLERLMINLDYRPRSALKEFVNGYLGPEDESDSGIILPYRYKDALLSFVDDVYEQDGWNPSEHLGELEHHLYHLKVITVKEFLGSKNEMRLLAFLLGKAVSLEQLIIFDLLQREECELREVFATVPRASSQLEIVSLEGYLLDDKMDYVRPL